jgi:hypothetical protein
MTRREQNVYCAIVADSGSRRHAGRLAQVLRTRSSAFVDFLDAHEVEKTLPQLPRNARIVFVGDNAFSRYIRRSLQLGYSRWGVRWATKGRMACIWSEKDEPDTDELLHEIRKELDECRMLTRSLRGSLMDEDDSRGPMYAAWYLDDVQLPPDPQFGPLFHPFTTLSARIEDARTTLGVVQFLLNGWEQLTEAPSGVTPAPAPSRR